MQYDPLDRLGVSMDISVGVVGLSGTSQREVAELTEELREAVGRIHAVEEVRPVETAAPGGAKGIGQMLGAFLVSLPGAALPAILDLIKAIVSRPSQPPVQIELTAGSSKVSFDPRQIKPAELTALIAALQPKGSGG
jgi:hypothetical protein